MSRSHQKASRSVPRHYVGLRAKLSLEALEDRLAPAGYVDGFEAPTLNGFWGTYSQSGSITFPSTARAHGGNQSVQLNSSVSAQDKDIRLQHTFSQPTSGRFSVWVFDTGANAPSGNYISFNLTNSVQSAYIHGYDYNFGGGATYQTGNNQGEISSGVARTMGWHKFEINASPATTTFTVDGVLAATRPGMTVDTVFIRMSGPSWRPAFVSYFDDFEYAPLSTPPTVDAGSDQTAAEGASVTWAGNFTDPDADTWSATVDYGDGSGALPLALNADKSFSLAHTYAQNGSYTATVTVTDSQGEVGTDFLAVLVDNAVPVITSFTTSSPGSGGAPAGVAVSIAAAFTDAGILDTHTALVNWGDGSAPELVSVTESNGSGTVAGQHAYASGGVYTVTLSVTDSDGDTDTRTAAAVVVGVGVHDRVLQVIGTNANNTFVITPVGSDRFRLTTDLEGLMSRTYRLADIDLIEAHLGGGHDLTVIAPAVHVPALLFGEAGNDTLSGGGASNILVGGDDNDMLIGGNDRDLLIGGRGSDGLVGLGGEDLLVADYTDHDATPGNLLAIVAEWTRTDVGYAARLDHLINGGGLNGPALLNEATVHDDNARDVLFGGLGRDAFFVRRTGPAAQTDQILDQLSNEFVFDTTP